jgi:hypothetical protein
VYRPSERAATALQRSVNGDPRHSIARDERPLRVRPKIARDYTQSAATMIAALDQARFPAIHFDRYVVASKDRTALS